MAERSTHEIETPIEKHKVVLLDWLNGGEKRAITAAKDDDSRAIAMINTLVVSVDGKKEKVVETLDAMHGKDFDFILTELGVIAEASSLQKKTS